MRNAKFVMALLSGVSLASLATFAYAQEENEIVVTAQNRSQNVQDVPIAIDVIGAEDLANAGFASMNDLPQVAPAVQLNQDQGVVRITVRGVGTATNDETNDTSVVVNIDGEYLNRGNALSVALFDMERVEVLRGPQGTLYGRNSTGGAINFITRKPGSELGGNLSASYGNYNATRIDGGVDIPLGDQAGLRLSGFYDQRDGYVEHPARGAFGPFPAFAGGESDTNESQGFRASFAAEPSDALTVNFAIEAAERDFVPQAFAATDLNRPGNGPTGPGCNAPGYVQVAPNYSQTLCTPSGTNFLDSIDRDSYDAPGYGLGNIHQETYAARMRVAYELSDAATLTYIGGFRHFEGDPNNFLTLPIAYRSYQFESDTDTNSHEVRLNGEVGGVIYQVGAFFFKEDIYNESGFLIPIGGPDGTFLSYFGRDVSSESRSVFGQVDIPVTETLTAVAGLRYTENERDAVYLNAAPFGPGPPDPALFGAGPGRKDFSSLAYLSTLNLEMSEDQMTWLAGLNYEPNEDTLIYGRVSTGFKGGGFDSVGSYAPETNTAYELGWKQNFGASGQHLLNLAGFYYDYEDLQVSVLLDTTVGGQVFNAGAATIWGLEAEGEFQIGEHGRLHGSINYLNAEYEELLAQFNVYTVPGTGDDVNGVGDLDPIAPGVQQPNFAGNTAPFSPDLVITAGYDHTFELGSAGSLTASLNTTYKSSYFTDFYNYSDGEQEGFMQSDFSLEYAPLSENFSVRAFVRNIEDERPLTYGSFVSAGPDDIFNWQFGTPRTYGVRVAVEY